MGQAHIKALSTEDLKGTAVIGPRFNPRDLSSISNAWVMDKVISSTIAGMFHDKQPYLWSPGQKGPNVTSISAPISSGFSFGDLPKEPFAANIPFGFDTGVLRDLASRLNVSVSCTRADSEFPLSCSGTRPLTREYFNINVTDPNPFANRSKPRFRTRVCAPGQTVSSPWQYTADRQDIYEEFWLDFQRTGDPPDGHFWNISAFAVTIGNYTQHCHGNSTLG